MFKCLGDKVTIFLDYTNAGSGFVYGYLVTDQNASGVALGSVFAFRVFGKSQNKSFTLYKELYLGLVCDILLQFLH